ncbi:MAG: aspartate aminotransferase family protein [Acidobacteria bacterium]|nr:aspartate aminotransferase family protein [Acidobacteriota bacterium]
MGHVLHCTGYDVTKTDIVRAEGCRLYDSRGRSFVDFEAGVWCTVLGHGHPRVTEMIRTQAAEVMHLGYRYTHELMESAALEVLDSLALPGGRCVFLSSGSEAVEFGVQAARHLTGKPVLLALANTYLAAYGSAGRKHSAEWFTLTWDECLNCPRGEACDTDCPRWREIPFDRIGGLVFEPGNSGGLVRLPPVKVVQALARHIRDRQGLVMVDEVTTGLGRTGAWYGFRHYGLDPDIIALGKGLGNGYPVSAVVLTHETAARLEDDGFRWAQSHQNDPLGCAVAREVVRVIRDEELVARSHRLGARWWAELQHMAAQYPPLREVRGLGLMLAVEFAADSPSFSLRDVYRQLLDAGFIVGYKPEARLLRFYPPLIIGEGEIDRLLAELDRILAHPSS